MKRSLHPCWEIALLLILLVQFSFAEITRIGKRVDIILDENMYNDAEIMTAIGDYEGIIAEKFGITFNTYSFPAALQCKMDGKENECGPEQLRAKLQKSWKNSKYSTLEGAIFIGDLPRALIQLNQAESVQTDLFYMDIDGDWNSNPSQFAHNLEIWVSRIDPYTAFPSQSYLEQARKEYLEGKPETWVNFGKTTFLKWMNKAIASQRSSNYGQKGFLSYSRNESMQDPAFINYTEELLAIFPRENLNGRMQKTASEYFNNFSQGYDWITYLGSGNSSCLRNDACVNDFLKKDISTNTRIFHLTASHTLDNYGTDGFQRELSIGSAHLFNTTGAGVTVIGTTQNTDEFSYTNIIGKAMPGHFIGEAYLYWMNQLDADVFSNFYSAKMIGDPFVTIPQETENTTTVDVYLYTGNIQNSTTIANIDVTLCGQDIDYEEKCFTHRLEHNMDTYGMEHFQEIVPYTLIDNFSVTLTSDNYGESPDWFVDSVSVDIKVNGSGFQHRWFPFCRWIGGDKAPNTATFSLKDPGYVYEFRVATGSADEFNNTETDSDIFVEVTDRNGKTLTFQLKDENGTAFHEDNYDSFMIQSNEPFDKIQKLRIFNAYNRTKKDWFVEDASFLFYDLKKNSNNQLTDLQYFPIEHWLGKKTTNASATHLVKDTTIVPLNGEPHTYDTVYVLERSVDKRYGYYISTSTAKDEDASTDANVTATIVGCSGETETFKLYHDSYDNFEPSFIEHFHFSGVKEMNGIRSITLSHDNTGDSPNWKIDSVIWHQSFYDNINELYIRAPYYKYKPEREISLENGLSLEYETGACAELNQTNYTAYKGKNFRITGINLTNTRTILLKLDEWIKPDIVMPDYIEFYIPYVETNKTYPHALEIDGHPTDIEITIANDPDYVFDLTPYPYHVSRSKDRTVATHQIVGTNFGNHKDDITVTFDGIPAEIVNVENQTIALNIPSSVHGSSVAVVVTRGGITAPQVIYANLDEDEPEIPENPEKSVLSFSNPDYPWTGSHFDIVVDNDIMDDNFNPSIRLDGNGFMTIKSSEFGNTDVFVCTKEVQLQVWKAENPVNPFWYGDVQMFVNIPSAGIYNNWAGQALWNNLEAGWNTVTITLSDYLYNVLANGEYTDASISFSVNTSLANADYRLGDMSFVCFGLVKRAEDHFKNVPTPSAATKTSAANIVGFTRNTISVKMESEGFVEVSVIKLNGGLVAKISKNFATAGIHEIPWNSSNISNGRYAIIVKHNGTVSGKTLELK